MVEVVGAIKHYPADGVQEFVDYYPEPLGSIPPLMQDKYIGMICIVEKILNQDVLLYKTDKIFNMFICRNVQTEELFICFDQEIKEIA